MTNGKILGVFLAMLLLACSTNRPLIDRGLKVEERRYYVIQSGYGIESDIKASFLGGFVSDGMDQELVFQLYGPPDRSIEDDTVWEYLDNNGGLITGMKFEDKKIIEIMGDPRGGIPVEDQK